MGRARRRAEDLRRRLVMMAVMVTMVNRVMSADPFRRTVYRVLSISFKRARRVRVHMAAHSRNQKTSAVSGQSGATGAMMEDEAALRLSPSSIRRRLRDSGLSVIFRCSHAPEFGCDTSAGFRLNRCHSILTFHCNHRLTAQLQTMTMLPNFLLSSSGTFGTFRGHVPPVHRSQMAALKRDGQGHIPIVCPVCPTRSRGLVCLRF
jgi:hypothetical protein